MCVRAQSCPTLCNSMNCNPPGSSICGILQARILEWVAIPTPGDLPGPGIKPVSPASPALAGGLFTTVPPGKPVPKIHEPCFVCTRCFYFMLKALHVYLTLFLTAHLVPLRYIYDAPSNIMFVFIDLPHLIMIYF